MTTRMRNELKEACNLEDIPLSVFVRWAIREKLKTYDLGEQKRTPYLIKRYLLNDYTAYRYTAARPYPNGSA